MQTAARRVIAYTLPWDDAPVDLSFIFEGEKPAGRHGFLGVKDSRFVFADGALAGNEPVAPRPLRILRVELHHPAVVQRR